MTVTQANQWDFMLYAEHDPQDENHQLNAEEEDEKGETHKACRYPIALHNHSGQQRHKRATTRSKLHKGQKA